MASGGGDISLASAVALSGIDLGPNIPRAIFGRNIASHDDDDDDFHKRNLLEPILAGGRPVGVAAADSRHAHCGALVVGSAAHAATRWRPAQASAVLPSDAFVDHAAGAQRTFAAENEKGPKRSVLELG